MNETNTHKLFFLLGLIVILFASCNLLANDSQPSLSPEPTSQESLSTITQKPVTSELNCISGYVMSGGDTSPPGLQDAPRIFVYEVMQTDKTPVSVSYTAYPPTIERKPFQLDFYAGSIQIGDFLEACGDFQASNNTLVISHEGDYIRTFVITSVILVRHTERENSSPNSNISNEGLARANSLVDVASQYGVSSIFTSDFCRTAQTGQPAAFELELPLHVQPSDNPYAGLTNCNPAISVLTNMLPIDLDISMEIMNNYTGKTVLIVGHSDTIPNMITALGGGTICPELFPKVDGQCLIPDEQYDNLFVVWIPPTSDPPYVMWQRY